MYVGIAFLAAISVVILTQVCLQGWEQRRRHEELMRRLDTLEGKQDS